jgi:hypothetical protein
VLVARLPQEVRRRLRALAKLQGEAAALADRFHREVFALRRKYSQQRGALDAVRAAIADVSSSCLTCCPWQ